MKKSSILLSVIVPIYNVDEYLEKCIMSICNQRYQNLQIILVDDGSTDSCGEICDEFLSRDNRIQVIHKSNGGLVSARKAGLKAAQGEYVTFVDGDDWIDLDCYSYLMEHNEQYDADMIAYACVQEFQSDSKELCNQIKDGFYGDREKYQLEKTIFIQNNFFGWELLPHLCDKIIKTEIVSKCYRNVNESISFGEDAACTYPCFMMAESLLVVNQPMYHYMQRSGSIVKKVEELCKENFIKIYDVLKKAFADNECLSNQLKMYMFFLLLLKRYSCFESYMSLFPFPQVVANSQIFVYGAGGFGKILVEKINKDSKLTLAGWTDQNYIDLSLHGENLDELQKIYSTEFDYLIIAILDENLAEDIKKKFVKKGIPVSKILYVEKEILEQTDLPEWITVRKKDGC